LHVRTTGDSEGLVTRIREEVRLLDATLPLTALATGESVLRTALTRPRHLTVLLGAFSLVALALAVVGLYGVLAYTVQRRRSDIAVRLALGGSPAAVLSMVVRQGMALASGGVALGMVGALGVTRVMEGVLYEVSPQDPGTLVAVAALMLAVSALACLVPGRRAIRIHPATALREE
jgi:ABC-type antimicrobial peptide transport system permease subunit